MSLTGQQKKYLRKNLKNKSIKQIASDLDVSLKEIQNYLQKIWGKEKYNKFAGKKDNPQKNNSKKDNNRLEKIKFFDFKKWFDENLLILMLLIILVFIAYFNSFFNEFLSDDIAAIRDNLDFHRFEYVINSFPASLRSLFNFILVNLFGKIPVYFRLLNIIFHLLTVLAVYLLVYLTINKKVAIFSAAILAVHPLQTEAVTWISGGIYSQYSFFVILALLFYVLSVKDKRFYYLSIASFILSLMSSEKAIIFPFILLAYQLVFKQIKDYKKLIAPFVIGGGWGLYYVLKVPQRIESLQVQYYEAPTTLNPLFQVPVALSSYIQLAFFPKGLTLYHSEMFFSPTAFAFKAIVVLLLLGLIFYSFWHNRNLLFWLLFFIISLLPVLTPLGISWIVAERYVYLGAIGIYVAIAIIADKLTKQKNREIYFYGILSLIVLLLTIRTIARNNDWKNQDNLWISAAKYSPNSAQNRNNLGDMFGRHGDLERAVIEFQTAIRIKPNYADAYHNLANTYNRQGKFAEAEENYKEALKYNPSLWQSHQNLSAIYHDQEKFDLSRQKLEQAIIIYPANPNLHTNLGFIYATLSIFDKAEEQFTIALQLNPQDQRAREGLAKLVNQ